MVLELVKEHFRKIPCWKCSGTGKIQDPPFGTISDDDLSIQNRYVLCPVCNGKGYINTTLKTGLK